MQLATLSIRSVPHDEEGRKQSPHALSSQQSDHVYQASKESRQSTGVDELYELAWLLIAN